MVVSKEEAVGRLAQQTIEKFGTEVSYIAGNATVGTFGLANKAEKLTTAAVAIESGRAVGSTAYKTVEDLVRDDKICAGACMVATACEVVAWSSAMIKYPGSMKVYVVAKSISAGCIRFRELCKTAKGEIVPC